MYNKLLNRNASALSIHDNSFMGMGPSTSFDHNRSQDTISLNSRDIRNYKLTPMKQINRDKSGNSVFQLNDLKQNSTI